MTTTAFLAFYHHEPDKAIKFLSYMIEKYMQYDAKKFRDKVKAEQVKNRNLNNTTYQTATTDKIMTKTVQALRQHADKDD